MWIWSLDCVHKMLKEKGKGSKGDIKGGKNKTKHGHPNELVQQKFNRN